MFLHNCCAYISSTPVLKLFLMALLLATSSSDGECDHEECTGARHQLPLPRDYPTFPLVGEPQFVYYAKVPQNPNQGTGATPEKRPNCFSKAFTWYTKERRPKHKCERSTRTENGNPEPPDDVVGFASWLDSKYAEFLRDSNAEPDYYRIKMTQTNTAQYTVPLNECCVPKHSPRSKSSKGKDRRTAGNSTEAGDSVIESFEFLLHPKEQDCLANQGTCCHKSNTTLNSATSPSSKTTKTLSASSVCGDTEPTAKSDQLRPRRNMKFKKCVNRRVSGPQFTIEESRKICTKNAESECVDLIPTKLSSPQPCANRTNIDPSAATAKEAKNKVCTADVKCGCENLIPNEFTPSLPEEIKTKPPAYAKETMKKPSTADVIVECGCSENFATEVRSPGVNGIVTKAPGHAKETMKKPSTEDVEVECDNFCAAKCRSPLVVKRLKTNPSVSNVTETKKMQSTANAICECVDLIPTPAPVVDCECGCSSPDLAKEVSKCSEAPIEMNKECQSEHKRREETGVNEKVLMLDKSCQTDIQLIASIGQLCSCSDNGLQQKSAVFQQPAMNFAYGECQTRVFPFSMDAVREYPLFMKILCADKLARARAL